MRARSYQARFKDTKKQQHGLTFHVNQNSDDLHGRIEDVCQHLPDEAVWI